MTAQSTIPEWAEAARSIVETFLSFGILGVLLAFGILALIGFVLWLRSNAGRRAWDATKRKPKDDA